MEVQKLSETASKLHNLLRNNTGFAITQNIAAERLFGKDHTPEQFGKTIDAMKELRRNGLGHEIGGPMNPIYIWF
jgi:hypothetical protein